MAGYQAGGLHTGGVAQPVGGHTHGQTGALHPGGGTGYNTGMQGAPVAESSDTRDRRSHTSSDTKNVNTTSEDKAGAAEKLVNTYGRIMSLLAILGALAGTILYIGGLAAMQRRRNNLGPVPLGQYSESFQSSLQVPYPGSASDQFAFQWYLAAIQFFVTMLCLFTLCLPQKILQRFKSATMVLIGYCFVLFTYEVQSLLFFKRNPLAVSLFSRKRILVTLIGAIIVAVFNGLTLLNLSLLKETNRDMFGKGGKRVAEEAHHSQTDDRDYDREHRGPGAV